MKTLSHYTQDALSKLLDETGAFYAFNNKQLHEREKQGVQYCSLGAGLVVPKENEKRLVEGLDSITKNGIEQDIAENGKAAIIRRELYNYECIYTGDITDCVDALTDYDITFEEVLAVYQQIS